MKDDEYTIRPKSSTLNQLNKLGDVGWKMLEFDYTNADGIEFYLFRRQTIETALNSCNSWAEYVATYSYLTIEEAKILYPLCKSINMQKEQAIALLQSKGDLELLYYTITHEGNKKICTEICADPDLILDKQPKKAQWDRINKCTKKDDFVCRWS